MHSFGSTKFLALLLLLLMLIAVWLLGRHQGTKAAVPLASANISDEVEGSAEIRAREFELELIAVRRELEAAAGLNTASEKTVAALQLALEDALEKSYEDEAELELYRKIAASDSPSGLGVDSVQFRSQPTESLLITLIQWRGRARIEGDVQVALEVVASGEEIDGSAPIPKVPLLSRRFDFRFFQKIEIDQPLLDMQAAAPDSSQTIVPQTLEITLIPDVKGMKSQVIRVPWADVTE